MPDAQIRIAAQLLSGSLNRVRSLSADERTEDLRLALELAEELLRQRGRGVPTFENSPPTSELSPTVTATKERLIEREPLAPLDTLLANRCGRTLEAAEKPGRKGPTVH